MLGQSTAKGRDAPWVKLFSTTFNCCVQVEARADHLSADSGALLLREIMERTGIVEWMTGRLVDPRDPNTITYPLADLLRTNLLLLGQGWREQDDADRLRDDPSFRVANDSRRGTACLERDRVLPDRRVKEKGTSHSKRSPHSQSTLVVLPIFSRERYGCRQIRSVGGEIYHPRERFGRTPRNAQGPVRLCVRIFHLL